MTRKTNARLAGFMFLLTIVTGIAGMVLYDPDLAMVAGEADRS